MAERDWLDWEKDGSDWPFRETSRFVSTGGYRWHVQVLGPDQAPPFLLLHGTGAASFSWRTLIPLLKDRFRLIVPDLPCHAFSRPSSAPDLSLEGMTTSLRGLFRHLDIKPEVVLGHSAGAAIGVSLAAAAQRGGKPGALSIRRVFSVNGALKPIRGNRLLSPMAKALFANPLSATMFSLLAQTTPLGNNLLAATGSQIDPLGDAIYRRLLGSSGHVRGALGMMASWDLSRLNAMLRRLTVPLDFFAAEDDPMVPASGSAQAVKQVGTGSLTLARTGGHLVHESHPDRIAAWIDTALGGDRSNGMDAA